MIARKQQGFTLIEIMIVVVILGILASLIVPKIINRPEQARVVKAEQDILALQNALDLYKLDNGSFPSTEQGLQALVKKPQGEPSANNWQGYLRRLPNDPWGHQYRYQNPGQHGDIDIFSQGASDKPKTIGNWQLG